MAGEQDTVVEVDDENVVVVDLEDPELAALGSTDPANPVVPAPKPAAQRSTKPSAADEAAAALTQTIEHERAARTAAEATAESERRRADEANRLAADRTREADTLRETAQDQQFTIIATGIETANRELVTAEGELERAQEAGDFKAAAKAQVRLAKAAAAIDRLETEKVAFESGAKKAPTAEGRVEAPAPAQNAFEAYVANYAPKAQAWLRAHPDCVPTPVGGTAKKNAQMMAGHYAAIAAGHDINGTEYFRVIDEHIGERTPMSEASTTVRAGEADPALAPQPKPKPRVMPSAPVTRDGLESGAPATKRNVRLTPQQQEVAKFSYPAKPGEADADWLRRAFGTYASEYVKAQAEGKIGRLTH